MMMLLAMVMMMIINTIAIIIIIVSVTFFPQLRPTSLLSFTMEYPVFKGLNQKTLTISQHQMPLECQKPLIQ